MWINRPWIGNENYHRVNIPSILNCINRRKYSPYYLCHFQDPTIPFRRLENPGRNYSENWANEALLTQAQVWSDIYENLTKAKDVQEKQYNKDAVEREFQDGDLVFLYDEMTSASQNPKLVYKIIRSRRNKVGLHSSLV